jgi:cbb3-type cytochrome oxidase maturation protein
MEILYLLIPLSVVLALLIAVALWWAVRRDQFEDLDAAGARILLDDDRPQAGVRPQDHSSSKSAAR